MLRVHVGCVTVRACSFVMGDTLSTCAGEDNGSGRKNETVRRGQRKPSWRSKNEAFVQTKAVFASPKIKQVDYGANLRAEFSEAKQEYDLEKAHSNSGFAHQDLDFARRRYITKLRELQALASTNFQFTVAQQIELEIQATSISGKDGAGSETFVDMPLEVPTISPLLIDSSPVDRRSQQAGLCGSSSSEEEDDDEDNEGRTTTIRELPQEQGTKDNIFFNDEVVGFGVTGGFSSRNSSDVAAVGTPPTSTREPEEAVVTSTPAPPQTYEERQKHAWKDEFSTRLKEKADAKSRLQQLLLSNALGKAGVTKRGT